MTFAPLEITGATGEETTEDENAAGDATAEVPASEEVVTPAETDESDTPAAATREASPPDSDDTGTGVADQSDDAPDEEEIAALQLVESLPFAVTADGALTVTLPVHPLWLALTLLDRGDIVLAGMPGADAEGDHPVVLVATDAAGIAVTQSFTITAELDPNPFHVDEQAFTTDEDTGLAAVLVATHAEGAELFFRTELEPENGTVTAVEETTGAFTYEPLLDFHGDDFFTIRISDELARAITVPVTITVEPVNDAPQIELANAFTVTAGTAVELPVVVTDVDSEYLTVTVEALPPDLLYADERIAGVVTETAVAGSPYLAIVTAEDDEGEVATLEVTWVVEAVSEEESGSSDGGVSNQAEDDKDVEDEGTPGSGAGAEQISAITLALTGALSVPGMDAWADYGWQAPVDLGDCPANADARTPAPLAAGVDLFADGVASDPATAPLLTIAAELPVGDYALLVCGCAPTYSDGERTSMPATNQALFAGIDGIVYLGEAGIPVPVSGFADRPGFTWQMLPAAFAGDGNPALVTVSAEGTHSVDVWMADDGVLISAVRVVPAAALADATASVGQACADDP